MILVTGGTGLVGSHLLYELTKTEKKVRAIYRSEKKIDLVKHVFSYYTSNVDQYFSKIEWIKATLLDIPDLTEAFKGITKVYHCAAFISFDVRDYYTLRRVNIEGTANIVNLSISNQVKKLCYVSSIATIGKSEHDTLITEETHWNPEEDHSVYAITKYGAEMEVWRGTQEGLDAVIVNPGVIIGPGHWRGGGSGSLIKLVYKGLTRYTNGSVGYVSVIDVVKPMILLMENSISNHRYILVSENLSYKDFFTKAATYLKVKAPTKKASKLILSAAWRLDWLRAHMLKKKRRLTKHAVRSITTKSNYDNNKIKDTLNYNFESIDDSLALTCQLFLKDLE